MPTAATFTIKSLNSNGQESISQRSKSGPYSSRWLEACRLCMSLRLCTEISSQLTYSWPKMAQSSLVIWMCPKLPRKACSKLKLEHHTMRAQKCGKISLMIKRVISGVSVASFTRCAHCSLLSKQWTWTHCSRRWPAEFILHFHWGIQMTFHKSLLLSFNKYQQQDLHVARFSACNRSRETWLQSSTSLKCSAAIETHQKSVWSEPSVCPETWFRLVIDFLAQITKVKWVETRVYQFLLIELLKVAIITFYKLNRCLHRQEQADSQASKEATNAYPWSENTLTTTILPDQLTLQQLSREHLHITKWW